MNKLLIVMSVVFVAVTCMVAWASDPCAPASGNGKVVTSQPYYTNETVNGLTCCNISGTAISYATTCPSSAVTTNAPCKEGASTQLCATFNNSEGYISYSSTAASSVPQECYTCVPHSDESAAVNPTICVGTPETATYTSSSNYNSCSQ
jgi:hypothetical protein